VRGPTAGALVLVLLPSVQTLRVRVVRQLAQRVLLEGDSGWFRGLASSSGSRDGTADWLGDGSVGQSGDS